MIAAETAAALGGARRSGCWWRCICPVHGSRTRRSATLAIRDGAHGLIAVCHAGCSRAVILEELRRLGLIPVDFSTSPLRSIPHGTNSDDDRTRRIELARRIWDRAEDASGSAAAAYLGGRGITIPVPPVLRWSPSLRRPDGNYGPAIVARVDDVDGRLIGVHRTWLACDPAGIWMRRDRASLGPIAGGAVRLGPVAETMLIGEGVETCLAAMQATAQAAWAALSTAGMARLVLPRHLNTVLILADHDANGAGERAARAAADRWLAEGRRVRLAMPPEPGSDFNDVLLGRSSARIERIVNVAA